MNRVLILMVVLVSAGCTAVDITAYRDNKPKLDFFHYFEGDTKGWGIVQDRKGTLLRKFDVDIRGSKTGENQLILEEEFTWSDGEESTRTWVIDRRSAQSYTGTADDVVYEASGISSGNVLNWKYQLNFQIGESSWKITFDDWMFQVSDQMLINRATMSKFGFTVGEVTIVFRKPDSQGGKQ